METPTSAKVDRAVGVLLGLTCGDALGVPYEFRRPALGAEERPHMKGGGLGPYEPGEYSDDGQMAVCIAQVAATGVDLASSEASDAVAERFVAWSVGGASDIGAQTSAVIAAARRLEGPAGGRLTRAAMAHFADHPTHSAGNGALMRTAVVGISSVEDRGATARAARALAELTHADPLAGDSCVLWSEAVRVAVLEGRFDLDGGLDLLPEERRVRWQGWIGEATGADPGRFSKNGFTVGALQAAWAAITATPVPEDDPARGSFACQHLQLALEAAVRVGHDTDTVAAICGSLLGARWGGSAVPLAWRRLVHGWSGEAEQPVYRARDLVGLAVHALRRGADDDRGWPGSPIIDYGLVPWRGVPHPADGGVLLGTAAPGGDAFDAVVTLCRIGHSEPWAAHAEPGDHVEVWLMDKEDPARNPNLHFVIDDAARTVEALRGEGKRVWLHCVAAHNRTPTVAARYGVLRGRPVAAAKREVKEALGLGHEPTRTLWLALEEFDRQS